MERGPDYMPQRSSRAERLSEEQQRYLQRVQERKEQAKRAKEEAEKQVERTMKRALGAIALALTIGIGIVAGSKISESHNNKGLDEDQWRDRVENENAAYQDTAAFNYDENGSNVIFEQDNTRYVLEDDNNNGVFESGSAYRNGSGEVVEGELAYNADVEGTESINTGINMLNSKMNNSDNN